MSARILIVLLAVGLLLLAVGGWLVAAVRRPSRTPADLAR
jgi:hypothetical protein